MKIIIINGPNLNLLGKREPEVYGNQTFEDYFETLKNKFPQIELHYFQSNIEGELITKIQDVGFSYDGIILNAGAYTHTSIGIGDAIKAITTPVILMGGINLQNYTQFTQYNIEGIALQTYLWKSMDIIKSFKAIVEDYRHPQAKVKLKVV